MAGAAAVHFRISSRTMEGMGDIIMDNMDIELSNRAIVPLVVELLYVLLCLYCMRVCSHPS